NEVIVFNWLTREGQLKFQRPYLLLLNKYFLNKLSKIIILLSLLYQQVFFVEQKRGVNYHLNIADLFPVNAYPTILYHFSCFAFAWKNICFREKRDYINSI